MNQHEVVVYHYTEYFWIQALAEILAWCMVHPVSTAAVVGGLAAFVWGHKRAQAAQRRLLEEELEDLMERKR